MFSETDLPLHIRYRVTDAGTLREAQCDSRLWVALTGDRMPVGFAMVDTIDGVAHLDELDVLPEFGRRGIGTRLVNTIIDWARENRSPRVTLTTFRHLPWNAPFYEKLGFVTMADEELGAGLVGLLRDEARAGLDRSKRICMRRDLAT